jgi:CubicO group peptidase (beta-lactamase class C family)
LLVGRAIEDGAPYRAATLVREVFAHYAPFAHDDARKDRMTVGDLMAMNSGLACDDNDDASPGNEATMQSQTGQPDWYKFTLDLPMAYEPGAHPSYCTAGINLLGGVIARGVHRWLPIYFDERFAQPMQFKQYGMWLMPPPLSDAYMGGGDYFRPRDFLKFGQLFLNHGTWHGRHVISDAWLHKISTKHATIEGEIGDYGYGWHIISYRFRGRTIHAINAGGNGGQLLFVFPQFDMAVMITAGNYGQYPVWSKFITQLVPRYILPAVTDVRRCCPKDSKGAGRRSSQRR